ncbi:leukocyte elastase inhibitor-like protein [Leptotrombidium deliense]|uniref:Leukocyte elastase inhibitor-like protein n=1 Tax=Leptotrombidium deliense TaxID=299467 RepID=A0A443S8R7_9ACAR|nr:leukocyte elastase inhibitor-like protein [Leptotrombidium deliense]
MLFFLQSAITEFKLNFGRKQGFRNITVEYANLMLMSKNFQINQSYIDALKVDYLASVGTEDFANDGEKIMNKVNTFVKERTHNLITKILNEPLNADTIMFLLNSIYIKAFWEKPFSKGFTINADFDNFDKTKSNVKYLTQEKSHRFIDDKEHNVKIIEMNYLGNASMIIVLPNEKEGLKRVIENISMKQIESIKSHAKQTHISVKIPKLKYEFGIDLKTILPKMGLTLPFTKPDFSEIAEGIKISEAKHKAMIAVDEAGTVAAAVTTIELVPESLFVGPKFIANHPFLYIIRDKQNGVNLFVGVANKLESL